MDLVRFYSGVTIISINYYKFRPIFRRRGLRNKVVQRKEVFSFRLSVPGEADSKITELSKKKKKGRQILRSRTTGPKMAELRGKNT